MSDGLRLTGYGLSVYTRAVRMALAAKGEGYDYAECDPFDAAQAEGLRALHPFARVPVLDHGAFRIYETQAILDYLEAALPGPALTPGDVKARARMRQVMGITDAYLYWPLVRQAFSHAVFQPRVGEGGDPGEAEAGLRAAPPVLDALEEIAGEGLVLVPGMFTLADCLLWPMLDYFREIPEGAAMLKARPALHLWAAAMDHRPEARATRPDLPEGGQT